MDENSDSASAEELPRCSPPEISRKLEERIEALKNPDNSQKQLTVVINLNNGKVLGQDRKNAKEIIASRHPTLFEYFDSRKISNLFLKGSGQVVAEITYEHFNELKNINHGEINSLDYSGYSLDTYHFML